MSLYLFIYFWSLLKNAHILILGTHGYGSLHGQKGITFSDGMKDAQQLTLQ